MVKTGSMTVRRMPNPIIVLVVLVVLLVAWANLSKILSMYQSEVSRTMHLRSSKNLLQLLKSVERSQAALSTQINDSSHKTQLLLQRLEQLEKSTSSFNTHLTYNNLSNSILQHNADAHINGITPHTPTIDFQPLKDEQLFKLRGGDYVGLHSFMSAIRGRGKIMGPPELHYFPSNTSQGRLLCIKGNNTVDGTKNFYGFAAREAIPAGAMLVLPGTTLISDTYFDFHNPWHSMHDLVEFVHWKLENGCESASRIVLYHWGELRVSMGNWISNVMEAVGLPWLPEALAYSGRPVCFDRAVVSRTGINSTPRQLLYDVFRQVRCRARQKCHVAIRDRPEREGADVEVHVTLMVRKESRGFKNLSAWQAAVGNACGEGAGCVWSEMHAHNLTFCEQVEIMSNTDILVSVHGAQLTNTIFMDPGGRILEVFPKGWLEWGNHGQFVYRNLANWLGLKHEGIWRDSSSPDCPNPKTSAKCFAYYKNQLVGINETFIVDWLRNVIVDFKRVHANKLREPTIGGSSSVAWDSNICVC